MCSFYKIFIKNSFFIIIIIIIINKQTKTEESHWSCAKEPETPYKTHFRTYVLNTIKTNKRSVTNHLDPAVPLTD